MKANENMPIASKMSVILKLNTIDKFRVECDVEEYRQLEPVAGPLGTSGSLLGSWGLLGDLMVPLGPFMGRSWFGLSTSWGVVRLLRVLPGCSWGALGLLLAEGAKDVEFF